MYLLGNAEWYHGHHGTMHVVMCCECYTNYKETTKSIGDGGPAVLDDFAVLQTPCWGYIACQATAVIK